MLIVQSLDDRGARSKKGLPWQPLGSTAIDQNRIVAST